MKKIKQIHYMTYIIIAICILTFVSMLFIFGTTTDSLALIVSGAKLNYLMIENNEWWRLVSSAFLHIGISHLLLNMVSLYFAGSELENILGPIKFTIIYLFAAVGGNLFSFAFNTEVISAGASTAVFGLFAAYIGLAYLFPHSYELQQRAQSFLVLIIINLINGFISTGIDNYGHIGGAIYGFLTTLIIVSMKSEKSLSKNIIYILILILLTIVLLYIGIKNTDMAY